MQLKVGELARRSGLTVRTLHHYHRIGLLEPSARSDAGYRLYTPGDVTRLYRIVALRRLGLSLTDIGITLSDPRTSPGAVIERQIQALEASMQRDRRLHRQLCHLREHIANGQHPDPAFWLDTLELMTMYENYFSSEELDALPVHTDPRIKSGWDALIAEVQTAMEQGLHPGDAQANALALRWMRQASLGTGNNPDFLMRLHAINQREPQARRRNGITPALERFIENAVVAARLNIFSRYLDEHEMARMREHYGKQMYAWPPLISALLKARDAGLPASDPTVQQLARRWMALFTAYAGHDPATHARIREAYAAEPDLRSGSAVDQPLLLYVRASLESMGQSDSPGAKPAC
ncbi:MerR family transcriptional regulator [Oleiagrimonas sp. C23AA]|uniref:MerR family transcriptional regulator n=1 Tax=Oleiagrimonas sp. C23AA TaxID=2719047 RepID=UPI00141F45C8|nr:MerR family transcriptional regulator [Oleiagrimonas sp. C23AA]NII09062.1 MerR family DNA-binding transcriptional regulator [Oleiagrimonas sp. C23AA]